MHTSYRAIKYRSPVPSDIDCSHSVPPLDIKKIAASIGINVDEELELYGSDKAKVHFFLS